MKPILFNTEMVRAILDGRKTTTRRIIKLPDGYSGHSVGNASDENDPLGFMWVGGIKRPAYFVGDVLYVRETFNSDWCDHTIYKADGGSAKEAGYSAEPKWHPSLHMPKEAARIFLKVTGVRAERLQSMTQEDAAKEGLEDPSEEQFAALWNSTVKNSDLDRYGWNANPFVWVIEFEQCGKAGDTP